MKYKSAELGRLSAICFHKMANSFTGLLFIVWNIIRIEVSSQGNSMHWEHNQNILPISATLTEKKVEPKRHHPWSRFMVRNSASPLALFWCHLQRCHFRGWSHFFPNMIIKGKTVSTLQSGTVAVLAPLFFSVLLRIWDTYGDAIYSPGDARYKVPRVNIYELLHVKPTLNSWITRFLYPTNHVIKRIYFSCNSALGTFIWKGAQILRPTLLYLYNCIHFLIHMYIVSMMGPVNHSALLIKIWFDFIERLSHYKLRLQPLSLATQCKTIKMHVNVYMKIGCMTFSRERI